MKKQAEGYVNPLRILTIKAILASLPGAQVAISARSGIHKATVSKIVKELRKAGAIHIVSWNPHPVRGPSIPVYTNGPSEDAIDTRPRLTRKEILERFEKRIKGTEKQDQRLARYRSRHWVKKAKATPHDWAATLFVGVRLPLNAEG
jgi:DNA-binding Lrp family transcriptional regulator